MAAPMAVPRPVARLSMAFSSAVWSVVGATASWAKPENTTSPIRVPAGCELTKSRAAFWATLNRFGCTSVEHIDRDSSRARMIDVRPIGTSDVSWGRADATPSRPRLASSMATGKWRRQRDRRGRAVRRRARLE